MTPSSHSPPHPEVTPASRGRRLRVRFWLLVFMVCAASYLVVGQIVGLLARQSLTQGRVSRAANLISWGRRLCPWDASLDSLAAQSARRRGDAAAWNRTVEQWAAKSPRSNGLKIERELMRIASGDPDPDAESQARRLIASGVDPSEIAEAQVLGYLTRGNHGQAHIALSWWEGLNLRAGDARLYRGILSQMLGEFSHAKKDFEAVLAEHPQHEMAQSRLADLLVGLGATREALKFYRAVIREAPLSVAARVGAARCLRELGMWNSAELLLKELLSRPDHLEDVIRESGLLALEKGNYDLAESQLTAAVESRTPNHGERMAMATLFSLQGHPARGLPLIQQDAKIASLRKRVRDLQVTNQLEPDNIEAQRQLQEVNAELSRIEH